MMVNVKSTHNYLTINDTLSANLLLFFVFFILGVVSKLPFQSNILHHWDSVNFALALDNFDIRIHQPHPPGMFVLYILLGRGLNYFIQDANTSLVWISIISSGLAVSTIFLLGSTWFGKPTGVIIAFITLSSPLIWFHSEVALSYMPEFFWVLLIVLACYQARFGSYSALVMATLLMGLAGGVRPNTPFFMFPLWAVTVAWGVIDKKFTIKQILGAVVVGGIGILLWLIPLIIMSGGLNSFFEQMEWWRSQHVEDTGNAEETFVNVARLTMYIIYALGIILIPAFIVLIKDWRKIIASRNHWPSQMLIIWTLPALLYFLTVHIRQPGHTFTIMPAFMIIGGLVVVSFAKNLSFLGTKTGIIITAMVITVNSLIFLLGPVALFGNPRLIFNVPTWATIYEYDNYIQVRLKAIRDNFSPEDTTVIANSRNFRIPDFYLADYQDTRWSYELDENLKALPDNVRVLVLFDDGALPNIPKDVQIKSLKLPTGDTLRYINWNSNQRAYVSNVAFKLEAK